MSRQVDFFAHTEDTPEIARILQRTVGDYLVTRGVRGSMEILAPGARPIPLVCERSKDQWLNDGTIMIIPPWAKQRLHPTRTERVEGEFIIETHSTPVLEYECSFFEEATGVSHRGRFYWSFTGRLQDEHLKSIERFFRALRAASERLGGSGFLRVFPKAKELATAFVLNSGVPPTPSPYRKGGR
jgi:hypothetical protein